MDFSRQAADPEWKQLLRLGEQLAHQPTPAAQCRLIEETINQLLSARTQVWLVSPTYPLPGMPPGGETLPEAAATPLVHQTLAEKKIQLIPAGNELASRSPDAAKEREAQVAAMPMLVSGNLLGIVQVERPQGPPLTQRELSFLEGLVTHATAAMEISRQEILKDWRYEQLRLVREVSAKIANLTDLNQLYDQVTQLIQETFNYYYVAIFNIEERQNQLRFRSSASQNNSTPLKPDFVIPLGEGIIGTVAKSGVEITAPDVQKESRYRYMDVLPETRSEAALPLKVENRILGVLDVQSDQISAFHETDMLVLHALADNIALAIESTHLYNSLERRAEQVSTVFEVSHALASILNLDELLDEVVRLIQQRFGYSFVHLYTVHPGRRLVIYQAGTGARSAAMKQQSRNYPLNAPRGLIPWVARNGQTFLVNDVSLEPLYLPSDVPPHDTRAELSIPLIAGDEVLGVLDIQSQETNAFDENDRSLFEALAAPIAVAMRNANLYRSEQWRRKVAESFRDVAHLISANIPLNQLLDITLEKLENNLPCDASAIWLFEEEHSPHKPGQGHHLRLAATRNIDTERIFEVLQEKSVLNFLERALEVDQPLIRRPEDPRGPLGAALGFDSSYSSIAAPMRTGQRALGVLTLVHQQEGRYGSEAQAITATFASYAAVAIQNARLFSEAQEQALISTMLLQVAEASQSIMNIEDLLTTMVRLARLLMGVKKCAFLLWEDSRQLFELKAWYGFEPGPDGSRTYSLHLPALAHLTSSRTLQYLDDPVVELSMPEMQIKQGTVLMLPLLVRGEVIGAFVVGLQMASVEAVEPGFDPKALSILQGIAHQTSMTIDNLQLLEARQEEAYVTAALLQVAQAVVSSNDLNDTLDTIVHLLPILVGIETCIIYLWDAVNQLFRPTQVYAPSRREEDAIRTHAFAPGEYPLLDSIRLTDKTHLCPIPEPDLPFEAWPTLGCDVYEQDGQAPSSTHTDWVLGYPLTLQGQVMGILMVREMTASPAFWERRLEIIHGIAQQTSLAIQNDLFKQELVQNERIEREIQLARQIQETFLPDTLPQLNHWDLDLRWETAREIGGDFYDIFKLDDKRVGLVIADVADKGLPAALYMTVTRTLIRASAADNSSPANVLEEVNKLLVNDSSESMFITAVYAILTLSNGKLIYANAGHNLPLLYRLKTGTVEQLPKGGTALGILDDLKLTNHELEIHPGDALVLFTDGVTDLLSPTGDFFGNERLQGVLQQYGSEPVQDMLEYLDDAMIEFRRGVPPADDVTLLAIRREPAQQRRERAKNKKAAVPEFDDSPKLERAPDLEKNNQDAAEETS